MIAPVSKERWQEAQVAERACHSLDFAEGYVRYEKSYEIIFSYLGIERDQHGKSILEIGPADFPALGYCEHVRGTVIEPMESANLKTICDALNILILTTPLEEISQAALDEIGAIEVWCINTLQHVIDPEMFIAKCQSAAPVVRFFEPIDCGTCEYHPHAFSMDDFIRWFGAAERYIGGSVEGFHTADCAYGTWRRDA